MKTSIFLSLLVLISFSACEKINDSFPPANRNNEETEKVQSPHTTIYIKNKSHDNDALIYNVFSGTDTETGGIFPLERNSGTKVISTNLGLKMLYVDVEKTDSHKSISVLDSEGTMHCRNISGDGQETLTFENVAIEENKPLTVTYNYTKCPVED
jgi:hypothetical protein